MPLHMILNNFVFDQHNNISAKVIGGARAEHNTYIRIVFTALEGAPPLVGAVHGLLHTIFLPPSIQLFCSVLQGVVVRCPPFVGLPKILRKFRFFE